MSSTSFLGAAIPGARLRSRSRFRSRSAQGASRLSVTAELPWKRSSTPSAAKDAKWKPIPPDGKISVSDDIRQWLEAYDIHVPSQVGKQEASQIFHTAQAQVPSPTLASLLDPCPNRAPSTRACPPTSSHSIP